MRDIDPTSKLSTIEKCEETRKLKDQEFEEIVNNFSGKVISKNIKDANELLNYELQEQSLDDEEEKKYYISEQLHRDPSDLQHNSDSRTDGQKDSSQ